MSNGKYWFEKEQLVANLEAAVHAAVARPKVRKTVISIAAAFLVLQLYFVRELFAAELLFGFVFIFWLALAAVIYAVGTIGEHGLDWGARALRFMTQVASRSYAFAGELAKKSLRHPESAQ